MSEIKTWPGWECVKLLGAGSYGKVYEIEKEEFGKKYSAALKVISIPKDQSEVKNALSEGMDKESVSTYFKSIVQRITNEFALMSDMKGFTNIVSYQDHMVVERKNEIGWDILIRMELLKPLKDYFSEIQPTEKNVIQLGIDLCKAIELCWNNKIIHRDIKPENVFVSSYGDYKLGDFGVARSVENNMTQGTFAGTVKYMAPEVYFGGNYGHTADIYSIGMILYQYLNNGRGPFLPPSGQFLADDVEIAKNRRMGGEALPEPVNGSYELKRIVLKALKYNSYSRYQMASEFRAELEKCLQGNASSNNTAGFSNDLNGKNSESTLHINDLTGGNTLYSTAPTEDSSLSNDDLRNAYINKNNNNVGIESKKILIIIAIVIALLLFVGVITIAAVLLFNNNSSGDKTIDNSSHSVENSVNNSDESTYTEKIDIEKELELAYMNSEMILHSVYNAIDDWGKDSLDDSEKTYDMKNISDTEILKSVYNLCSDDFMRESREFVREGTQIGYYYSEEEIEDIIRVFVSDNRDISGLDLSSVGFYRYKDGYINMGEENVTYHRPYLEDLYVNDDGFITAIVGLYDKSSSYDNGYSRKKSERIAVLEKNPYVNEASPMPFYFSISRIEEGRWDSGDEHDTPYNTQSQLNILKEFFQSSPQESGYSLNIIPEDENNSENYDLLTLFFKETKSPVSFVTSEESGHSSGYGYMCYINDKIVKTENFDYCYVSSSGMVILEHAGMGRELKFFKPVKYDGLTSYTYTEIGRQDIQFTPDIEYTYTLYNVECSEEEFFSEINKYFDKGGYINITNQKNEHNKYPIIESNLNEKMTTEYVKESSKELFLNSDLYYDKIIEFDLSGF